MIIDLLKDGIVPGRITMQDISKYIDENEWVMVTTAHCSYLVDHLKTEPITEPLTIEGALSLSAMKIIDSLTIYPNYIVSIERKAPK